MKKIINKIKKNIVKILNSLILKVSMLVSKRDSLNNYYNINYYKPSNKIDKIYKNIVNLYFLILVLELMIILKL